MMSPITATDGDVIPELIATAHHTIQPSRAVSMAAASETSTAQRSFARKMVAPRTGIDCVKYPVRP